jgi:hypothetical protein
LLFLGIADKDKKVLNYDYRYKYVVPWKDTGKNINRKVVNLPGVLKITGLIK